MRKKISTGLDNAAAVVDLDDDDEIVKKVTTETVVGRRKRPEPEAIATAMPDFEQDDADAIDADLTDDEDVPEYGENSLAALIYDEDSENRVDNKFCSVAIRRNPDSMNDKFRNPCGAVTNYPPLRNIELTADRMDIEDKVRAENGGGHYFFQIHLNGRLGPSWKATLSDAPQIAATGSETAAAATQPAAVSLPPPANVDPLDALLANVDKFAKLKEVFGGGDVEKVRLEMQIAELRREIEAAKNAPQERKSERLTLLETAMKEGANSGLQAKILDNLFPSEEKESRHWVAEVLDVALQHKDAILEVAGPLLMSVLGGGPRPQPMPQFAPPMPPPVAPEPPKVSGLFAPRVIEEPQDEPAEPEPEAIATGLPTDAANKAEPEPEPDNTNAIDADEESTDAAAAA